MALLPENCRKIVYETEVNPCLALFRVHNKSYSPEYWRLCKALKRKPEDLESYYEPKEGEVFAYCVKEDWYRAYLIRNYRNNNGSMLSVYLIDRGLFCDKEKFTYQNCRPLPPSFSTDVLDSQSYKITLYGVIPICEEISTHDKPRKKKCRSWQPFHISFMKEQMLDAEDIYFELILQEGEIQFGYIFLEKDGHITGLHELLLEKQWAEECNQPDFETNEIPLLLSVFRSGLNFDRKLSVRKLLYPSLTFDSDEECPSEYCSLNSSSATTSVFSNYSSYSNATSSVSVENLPLEETTTEQTSNNSVYSENVTDDVYSDQTSDYNSQSPSRSSSVLPSNEAVLELQNENFYDMLDEILVLGNPNYFKPTRFIHTSPLDGKTRGTIAKCQLRDLTRCQSYLIPAMFSGRNVVMIDAPGSGKTIGCLMALISLLRSTNEQKRPGFSPRSLYILPYSTDCETVRDRCIELITGKDSDFRDVNMSEFDLQVTVAYGCGHKLERDKLFEIASGYDILICTPKCLLRLIEKGAPAFNLDRLEYIVYDELHTLSESFAPELGQIRKHVRDLEKKHLRQVYISAMFTAEMKKKVDEFVCHKRGIFLVPCFLEAAQYGEFEFAIDYRVNDSRICDEIKELLKSADSRLKNVVIVLNDEIESVQRIHNLYQTLASCSRPVYMMYSSSYLDKDEVTAKFEDDVSQKKGPILICQDHVLSETSDEKIYDADVLIHYNLPQKFSTFRQRFSVLLHRVQKRANEISTPSLSATQVEKPKVHCFISDSMEQFPRLLDIMTQLRVNPRKAEWIQNKLDDVAAKKERNRSDLCINVKQFGECKSRRMCSQRHVFVPEKDLPNSSLPTTGQLVVDIKHVYSPNHFRVRLIEHREKNGKWTKLPIMDNAVLHMKLYQHIKKNGLRAVDEVKEGDLFVTDFTSRNSTTPEYMRVRVIKILDEKPKKALVKFVDWGAEMTKPVSKLSQLPQELISIPETTIDIFISNLKPIDQDITWGHMFTDIINNEIQKCKKKLNIKFIGDINLVIGNSVWLNTLQCYTYNKMFQEYIADVFSVSKFLLEEQLAVKDTNNLTLLREFLNGCDNQPTVSHDVLMGSFSTQINPEDDHQNKSSDDDKENEQPAGYREGASPIKKLLRGPTSNNSDNSASLREINNTSWSNGRSKQATVSNQQSKQSDRTETFVENNQESKNSTNNDAQKENERISDGPNGSPSSEEPNEPIHISPDKQCIIPKLWWKQTRTSITLMVRENIEADAYTVTHSKMRNIRFEGTEGNKCYTFDITLFARFDEQTLHHYKGGVNIVIRMDKLSKDIKWSRLLKNVNEGMWVKEEISNEEDEDGQLPQRSPIPDFRSLTDGSVCPLGNEYTFDKLPYDETPSSSEAGSDWDGDDHGYDEL